MNMKQRTCDHCGFTILKGPYHKVCLSEYVKSKGLKLNHVGDLCLTCWDKINAQQ